jgi:hypothetical protein
MIQGSGVKDAGFVPDRPDGLAYNNAPDFYPY